MHFCDLAGYSYSILSEGLFVLDMRNWECRMAVSFSLNDRFGNMGLL